MKRLFEILIKTPFQYYILGVWELIYYLFTGKHWEDKTK